METPLIILALSSAFMAGEFLLNLEMNSRMGEFQHAKAVGARLVFHYALLGLWLVSIVILGFRSAWYHPLWIAPVSFIIGAVVVHPFRSSPFRHFSLAALVSIGSLAATWWFVLRA